MRTVCAEPEYYIEKRVNEAGDEESYCIVTFLDGDHVERRIPAAASNNKKAKALAAYRALVYLRAPVATDLDFEQENPEDIQLL